MKKDPLDILSNAMVIMVVPGYAAISVTLLAFIAFVVITFFRWLF